MKILHLADFHIKLSGPRAGEARRILDHIADHAGEIKPNVIALAGDLFDARSTPEERLFLADILRRLAVVAPVYAIHGNHDNPDDVSLFNLVRDAHVITEPGVKVVEGVRFAFLPWPKLGNLAATVGPKASIAERREIAKAALIDILRGFRGEINPGEASVVLTHMSISGAAMDSGQPVSASDEMSLSADEFFESGAAGILCGHIHLRQQMRSGDGRPVWYAGAPFRTTFGESAGSKGGLVWDWIGGAWRVTPWDAPARPMVLLEGKWIDGQLTGLEHGPLDDAEVRLRIEFPSEEREAARIQAEELKKALEAEGAHSVTIDERPVIVTRSRCVEITAARTTIEKLKAWAQSAGSEVPEDVEAKLQILEAEITI